MLEKIKGFKVMSEGRQFCLSGQPMVLPMYTVWQAEDTRSMDQVFIKFIENHDMFRRETQILKKLHREVSNAMTLELHPCPILQ